MGELLTVQQSGSGNNCGVVVITVIDPGESKATAGPVTPGDTSGSAAGAKPGIGQKLGDMLQTLGGMQGSISEAMDFLNVKGNMFPFETPPNKAVSDYYTLARGGSGQPETETPSASAIQKAIGEVKNVASAVPDLPFAPPTKNMPNIKLASEKLGGLAGSIDSLGIDRSSTLEEVSDAVKKAKAKFDSGTA